MRIAVYAGSFNPLHIGHQAVMEYLTRKGPFDWVYLVVSPQNPMKASSNAASGRERYLAAVEAVRRHPDLHVWVDDIELGLPLPNYTIRTLDALKGREPHNRFTLIVGGDQMDNFGNWKDYRRILVEYGIAVFPRRGHDEKLILETYMEENPFYQIEVFPAPQIDISSTEIREGLAAGRDMSKWMM